MLLAILHRHGGLQVSGQDVFVNAVGGIRVEETSSDLALILAVVSSFRDRSLPSDLICFGEVGLSGEIEHASAFIHTLRFGNKFRDAVGGTSYLSFTNTRGPAGCKISIPMMHKTDAGLRPYYLTHEFNIQDAPCDDEIVVAIGGSPGGRAHARTGDRYQDMKEMGIKNPK